MANKLKGQKLKGEKFTTGKVRLSFPKLFTAEKFKNKGDPKYSTTILFNKEDDLSKVKKAIFKAKVEAFGKNKAKWPKIKSCLKDGSNKSDLGYEDFFYINASTLKRPRVVVKEEGEITRVKDENEVFGGKNAQVVLIFKATSMPDDEKDGGFKYFITAYLQGVRLLPGGDPLGGGGASDEDFEDLEDEEDDESNYEKDSDDDSDEDDEEDEDDL